MEFFRNLRPLCSRPLLVDDDKFMTNELNSVNIFSRLLEKLRITIRNVIKQEKTTRLQSQSAVQKSRAPHRVSNTQVSRTPYFLFTEGTSANIAGRIQNKNQLMTKSERDGAGAAARRHVPINQKGGTPLLWCHGS